LFLEILEEFLNENEEILRNALKKKHNIWGKMRIFSII